MASTRGVRSELLWSHIGSSGRRSNRFDVNELLSLPEPVQAAVGALMSRPPPRVVVIANVDLLEEFDPAGRGFYGEFIDWLNSHEITLMVTATGEPTLERLEFEYSITLPKGEEGRPVGVCQWGDCAQCLVRDVLSAGEVVCGSRDSGWAKPRPFVDGLSASH